MNKSIAGAEVFSVQPFKRLARTHVLAVAGDALLAIALADSLFFNVDPNDARWKVASYLLLTIAPFAVVAPVLGPFMDRMRGGHRLMVITSTIVRAGLMFAMVRYVQGPLLFPLAFTMLIMGKTYAVAKSALVPAMVHDPEELVKSNSRLSVLTGIASAAAGVPGIILLKLGGSPMVLALGGFVFGLATLFGMLIPAVRPTPRSKKQKKSEKSGKSAGQVAAKGPGITLASNAMGYLRGVTGFVTLLLAFSLRGGIDLGPTEPGVEVGHRVREAMGFERLDLTTGGAPAWHFGVALAGVGLGGLVGSLAVPRLRANFREERILAIALSALAGVAVLASLASGVIAPFLIGFAMSVAGSGGKQSFDAIVQRDTNEANLGRAFSRFESRFQLAWVVGALIPSVIPVPARVGYIVVAITAGFMAGTYWFGRGPNPKTVLADEKVAEAIRTRWRPPLVRSRTGQSQKSDTGRVQPGRPRSGQSQIEDLLDEGVDESD